jgi:hypothetical protein
MSKHGQTLFKDRRYRDLPIPALPHFTLSILGKAGDRIDVTFDRMLDAAWDDTGKRKIYFNPGDGPLGVWQPLPKPATGQTLTVFCSSSLFDPAGKHRSLLHVSMNTMGMPFDYQLAKQLRDLFFPPDIDVIQVMPKASNYVNLHEHVYHLWQCPLDWEVRGV